MASLVHKIQLGEIVSAEVDFWNQAQESPEANEEMYKELFDFFANQPAPLIYNEHYPSYWRWFTQMTWARSGNFETSVFASQIMAKQVPIALALGYDVWDALIWHLHFRTPFSDDMASAYTLFREAFFGSDAVLGLYKGQLVAVKDLIPEIEKINRPGVDSLETAETMSKIQTCFATYSDRPELLNYFVKPEKSTDMFVGLVNFFLGVKPDRVLYVVDGYVHESSSVADTNAAAAVAETETAVAESVPIEAPVEEVQAPKVNYADVKNMIEARFTRDASGEFTNLDGVLALLDSLATDQGDDRIRELYYFDEGTGKFQWNEGLLA